MENSPNKRRWHLPRTGWIAAALLATAGAGEAGAQGVIDWPVRTTVRPSAVAAVPTAALWNPASAEVAERAELLALDADVPTGLRALAVAGAVNASRRLTFSTAYQHLRVDDIEHTTVSPMPDPNGGLDVSEHLFAVGAAYALRPDVRLGGAVRYARAGAALGGGGAAGAGAGVVLTPALPFSPRFGGSIFAAQDGVEWTAGVELTRPIEAAGSRLTLGWGANAGPGPGVAHRVAGGILFRGYATLHAAAVAEPEADGLSWHPALDASVRVQRYGLGFVHERLAQGFGGVNTFRISVAF